MKPKTKRKLKSLWFRLLFLVGLIGSYELWQADLRPGWNFLGLVFFIIVLDIPVSAWERYKGLTH